MSSEPRQEAAIFYPSFSSFFLFFFFFWLDCNMNGLWAGLAHGGKYGGMPSWAQFLCFAFLLEELNSSFWSSRLPPNELVSSAYSIPGPL